VRVLATNKIGSGAFSDFNTEGVLIQTEPVTPPKEPTIVEYTEYTVKLTFEILTLDQTGGSPIINYELVWDKGTNGALFETFDLLKESAGQNYILLTIYGLSSGLTYQFKYRA
jgi:hypothetical protein